MCWVFIFLISVLPVTQTLLEMSRGEAPQVFSLFRPIQQAWQPARSGQWSASWRVLKPLFDRHSLSIYEKSLEQHSFARRFWQPRVQALLTGWLGAGNEKGVLGQDGWLFYQPGLEYLTGPNFIDPKALALRAKLILDRRGEDAPHPDPRPALLALQHDLEGAGIHLVVFPAPDKAMLQPAQLARRMGGQEEIPAPNNPGYARFVADLRRAGVDVFDPAPARVRRDQIRFLAQDTHWTPDYMDEIASLLADHARNRAVLPPLSAPPSYSLQAVQVSRVGDLVDMLALPESQRIFLPQTVTIQRVMDSSTGQAWKSDPEADVLLLGDSYTNIYSSSSLGWGTAAGFAEHLSYHLRRPLDVLAMNGSGATGIRRELARPENRERLAGKRIVIYQFAIRDLAVENWVPIPLQIPRVAQQVKVKSAATAAVIEPIRPSAKNMPQQQGKPLSGNTPPSEAPVAVTPLSGARPAAGTDMVIVGTIQKLSSLPEPSSAPYPDCLTFVLMHVEKVESGQYSDDTLIAVFLGMKGNKWLAPAYYKPGDRVRMHLVPMKQAPEGIRATQRVDELNDYTHILYFVVSEEKL
jgi:alginate O-acetyltransferase complex protein AlgJ